jgi:pantothenate kinase-related protein Tda10
MNCVERKNQNGFIWHTTGSGKTLTSFKASTLLKFNKDIEKCVFVVDRKDLDKQTREEFNRFQEGCVEQNVNTRLFPGLHLPDFTPDALDTFLKTLNETYPHGFCLFSHEELSPEKREKLKQFFKSL